MLSLHNQMLNDIDLYKSGNKAPTRTNGRDAINVFKQRLHKSYIDSCTSLDESKEIDSVYDSFWNQYKTELAHYFRFLYNIIRYIDSSDATEQEKKLYMSLLRAQLSNQELTLIFYNCFSKSGKAFIKYVNKYDLFRDLGNDDLFDSDHMTLISQNHID